MIIILFIFVIMEIRVNKLSETPLYRQIIEFVLAQVKSGASPEGDMLPSMNELAARLDISKETVKKAYGILTERGLVEPRQGKGFYVSGRSKGGPQTILVLLDKLSEYKQIFLNTLSDKLGDGYQVTIRLFNQSVDLLKYYLDEELDLYDYYLVSPHFPLDARSQKSGLKQMMRIPNRKLIMIDNWMKEFQGHYGAVYQDFDNDIYDGLSQGLEDLKKRGRLNVISLPSSLYHDRICVAIRRFCADNDLDVKFFNGVTPGCIRKGDTYLLLNSQLDSGLLDLVRTAEKKGLEATKDISIISYNDSPMNQLVLGGLTTTSADFSQMGELAAKMILNRNMEKVRCNFTLTRRNTF